MRFSQGLGSDVEVAPKKTSVRLRRKKQFALVIPATKSRIELGLALKGDKPHGRLEPYNAMCSHRVCLETLADFDDQVKAWVVEAYSRSVPKVLTGNSKTIEQRRLLHRKIAA